MVSRTDRFHPGRGTNRRDVRSAARRDRDRILYSSAFRRLSAITQVVAPTERYPIHNRLTHTLKVAQVARSLAEGLLRAPDGPERVAELGGLDPDVTEAAALAHDLGHPPFGHVAERELDDLVKRVHNVADGFEGNAQSFRIVTRLAVRYHDIEGLNLTRATLGAILKYPWMRGTSGKRARKWGAYASEGAEFAWAREAFAPGDEAQGLEAAIMDWADDVTYAVHDLEDFSRAGLIPLDRLATDRAERSRFLEAELARQGEDGRFAAGDLEAAFVELVGAAPTPPANRDGRLERASIRSFTSELIDSYVAAVALGRPGDAAGPLVISAKARMEVAMLKALTWHYVIESRALVTQRYGQRNLIKSLFGVFAQAAASPRDWHIFPTIYQETLAMAGTGDEQRVRVVADLISSMSEAQVVEVHHRLTGLSLGSAMDVVLP